MSDDILIHKLGEAHVFTLNRPQKGNSLSFDIVEAFHDALDVFESERGRVLVVRGEGRHLCAGFDLSNIETSSDADLMLRFVRIEELLARIWSAPYETIAIGKGRIVGAGADLFSACNRRLMFDKASLHFPGAAFGIVLGTRRLGVRIGRDAAHKIISGGEVIDANHALSLGLATSVISENSLSDVLEAEIARAVRLEPIVFENIQLAFGHETDFLDRDLAMLTRSAARSGLRERIISYRAQVLKS